MSISLNLSDLISTVNKNPVKPEIEFFWPCQCCNNQKLCAKHTVIIIIIIASPLLNPNESK